MKVCSKCKKSLSESEFNKHIGKKDGLQLYCRDCHKIMKQNYRKANPEKNRANTKRWRLKYPEKRRIQSIKNKTKRRRNLQFIPLHDNPFPSEIPVHWHHINKTHVVAIPAKLHIACSGGNNRSKHLRLALAVYEQFYNEGWEER
jgi:hypothetical protein